MWETAHVAFAGVSLLIYFTITVVSAVAFLFNKIDKTKTEILTDVNLKHEENRKRVDAMQTLLIRHDTLLAPEYNGNFGHRHG